MSLLMKNVCQAKQPHIITVLWQETIIRGWKESLQDALDIIT